MIASDAATAVQHQPGPKGRAGSSRTARRRVGLNPPRIVPLVPQEHTRALKALATLVTDELAAHTLETTESAPAPKPQLRAA